MSTEPQPGLASPEQQQFQELLEAAPDAIMQADAGGRIMLLNRVAETMFGYSREELLGQPIEVLIPTELRAAHVGHREKYRGQPATRPMGSGLTLEGVRKDGTRFPVEISLSPAGSGASFRVTAIIRDITDRKRAEENLQRIQDTYLRELSAANRELEVRNREVERANRLKSEFLASMSHELRTPLHTIIGFSELLAEESQGPLNDKQKRFLNHIHTDSIHLLQLINDILDISRIEAGRLELRREAIDVKTVVEESIASIRHAAHAKSISIDARIEVPETIDADRLRVKQILVNLLSNAVKFTPSGGKISVRANFDDASAVFSVSDTGVGIPEEEHASVFETFYQSGNTTKGVREGTGLGLPITKRLVEEHGGTITLTSKPGEGSCFTFTIPARAAGKTPK
jgi:PAS domain S-box-containing protein